MLRALTARSTGEPIDWDKDYPNLGRAHQCLAAAAEKLGVTPKVDTYKGNLYLTNVEEIHTALGNALK